MSVMTMLAAVTVVGQCPSGYYTPPPVCYTPPVVYCQPTYYQQPVRYYAPAPTYQPQYSRRSYQPQYASQTYTAPRATTRTVPLDDDDDYYTPPPKTMPRIGIRESYTPRTPLPGPVDDDDDYIPPARRLPVRETQPLPKTTPKPKSDLPDGYLRRPSDIPDRR